MWRRLHFCPNCHNRLGDDDRYCNGGMCPYCAKQAYMVADSYVRAARWITTSPKWKFWVSEGYWQFKDEMEEAINVTPKVPPSHRLD